MKVLEVKKVVWCVPPLLLVQEKLNGVLVSISRQLELHYEPFSKLLDSDTLVTKVRYIEVGSEFHSLAQFIETEVND